MAATEAAQRLAQIAEEVQVCTKCPLYQGARMGVPGSGDTQAEVMLIGEAPSLFDDRRGTPFSGPSGAFLDELLELAGLDRRQVYLTNVVKHRLLDGHELQPDEIRACADYLTRQIAAVNPMVIVTLGRYSLARFFPTGKISRIHGQAKLHNGRIVVAMYNPAAALHREELRQTVVDDFARALPAALAEARRLAAEGKLGRSPDHPDEGESPQQLSLF
ncbi:MAG: uracil-DNA glycosylase [Ktedonobacterales bacterium]